MERGFSFVIADLPGLIEGASEGLGLGHRFLRHVSRNRILVCLVAADLPETPLRQLEIVRDEIHRYDSELNMLEEVVVLSKIDLLEESEIIEIIETLGGSVFPLSSITGSGVKPFLGHLSKRVAALREKS
jgi:GTP-binding protein